MKNRAGSDWVRVIVAAAAPLLVPGLAWAQDDEPAEAPAETPEPPAAAPAKAAPAPAAAPAASAKIDVTAPEPPPDVARSYHVHDGFYLRMNIGFGAYGVRYDNDVSASGGSLALDLLIGGSPSRGVAVGGALLSDFAPNLGLKNAAGDINVETGLIGPFIDGFPNPKGGFHLGGMVGPASINTNFKATSTTRTFSGGGGSAWLGYDAWVGDEWSVGGLLRFTAAFGSTKDNGQTYDARSTALTLMFTALYH